MNEEEFRKALAEKGISLSDQQMAQFYQYYQLLVKANEKVNLTAITAKDEVYLKHFYDSLTLAFDVDLSQAGLTLVDVGSGAGFPSLPLKIAYPKLKVTIVESLQKRVNVLENFIQKLGLTDVSVYHERAEDFGRNPVFREQFDLATARAVARLNVLAEYCLPLVRKGGLFIAMKGKQGGQEIDEAGKAVTTLGGKLSQDDHFNLPNDGGERHLIIIEKTKTTPKKYPRKAGTPAKNPLT